MAPHWSTNYSPFREKLSELISFQEIACAAVESGFIIRSRKIFPVEFLLTLIFGFYSKEEPSIKKFLRIYNSLVDKEKKVVYSSFYERFNNEALAFVDKCLENYISKQKTGVNAELKGYLRTFSATRSGKSDCYPGLNPAMPSNPFWVSLPARACLATNGCEAAGTTW